MSDADHEYLAFDGIREHQSEADKEERSFSALSQKEIQDAIVVAKPAITSVSWTGKVTPGGMDVL